MADWALVLVSVPILAGDPGHITAVPTVDQASCLQSAITTMQQDLRSGNALIQAICMPRDDSLRFMAAAHCHDPDIHHNPDRIDGSCEGITKVSP
jgi:hypothetical protein